MPCYATISDEELFDFVKSDDAGAFKEIYERHFGNLFINAYRKLQCKEEARDVVQDVFASIWDKRATIVLTTSLSAYLYVAVRNKILNILCHQKVASGYLESLANYADKASNQTDYLLRSNELNSMIEKEVAALPARMQEIFELSRKQYLSHREIATTLNLSEQTVKTQVNNALRILRSKLGTAD